MLPSICQHIWKTWQGPQDWKKSLFHSNLKEGHAKECTNYHTFALTSYTNKVMLKILQASLWGIRHQRQRNQTSNCQHSLDHRESKGISEQHLLCFIDCAKDFDCVDHNKLKLWKILKEMEIPDHLNSLLRNLYVGQETTVRTLHGTTD